MNNYSLERYRSRYTNNGNQQNPMYNGNGMDVQWHNMNNRNDGNIGIAEDYEDDEDDDDMDYDSSSDLDIEIDEIDFTKVYAYHTFIANVQGQVCVRKDDVLDLLDDTHDYWWLVRCISTNEVIYKL